MVVNSEDQAYDLYNRYALGTGFSIRRDKYIYKSGTKEIKGRVFVCSKEGKSENLLPYEQRKTHRLDTRTECKASITFDVSDDMWVVSKFIPNHTHPLVPPEQRRFLRSGRKITESSKDLIHSMTSVGISPSRVYAYMSKEVGGVKNMVFTKRDCHNLVQTQRANMIGPGDALSLINYFKSKLVESPLFFHHEQLDDEGRLTNVFWTDGLSRFDYDCFGDVVIFDTTYRTNKYNMICAPFVGVNHHWKNIYFGCAFLQDETTSTFVWLFETFLEAMGSKAPKTIFTDQDHAMANAVKQVFPNTCHRLCTWHISKNATQHIAHLYAQKGFKDKFIYLMKYCESEEEFESTWKEMINEWGISENTWLKKLYELRQKWSPAFSHDTFSANIRSTQRSESTNNVFHQISGKTMTFIEFVHHYDDNITNMREEENEDDYNSSRGKPLLFLPQHEILKHASEWYTTRIFNMFQDEFKNCLMYKVVESTRIGTQNMYKLRRRGSNREHVVQFNPFELTVLCDCFKFESMGLLCRHALFVLNSIAEVDKIPERYILKRWTKGAKKGVAVEGKPSQNSEKSSRNLRLSNLMRRAFRVLSLGAENDEKERVAYKYLDLAEEEMHNLDKIKNMRDSCALQQIDEDNELTGSAGGIRVLDPTPKWPKGATYGRQKGPLEKRRRKNSKETGGFHAVGGPTMSYFNNQMHSEIARCVPFLVLDKEKKMMLFPLLFLHKEAPSPHNSTAWVEIPHASAKIAFSFAKWVHVGCEVASDLVRLHIYGEIAGEMPLSSSAVNDSNLNGLRSISLAGTDGDDDRFEGYIHSFEVLPNTSSIKAHFVKNPPLQLSVDDSSASEIEEDEDGVWSIVGGKASCRRNFSLDVTLRDAFGEPINKEMEVCVVGIYETSGTIFTEKSKADSKFKDREAVVGDGGVVGEADEGLSLGSYLLSQLTVGSVVGEDGCSRIVSDLIFFSCFSFHLNVTIGFSALGLRFQKWGVILSLRHSFSPIRCISRNRSTQISSVKWKRSNSSGLGEGSSELLYNIVHEAKLSPSSKRVKLGQENSFATCKANLTMDRADDECNSRAWTANEDFNAYGSSLERRPPKNHEEMDNSPSDSESIEARNSNFKSTSSNRSPVSDTAIFKYCLGGLNERALLLKEVATAASEKELADFARQVSLYLGCSHHGRQDLEILRRIAGCQEFVARENFEKMWCWLYPVAFTLSGVWVNAMWNSASPKWIEGFITKEEAESSLQGPGVLPDPGAFVLWFPTSRSWPHPDAANLVATYIGSDYNIHHKILSLDFIFSSGEKEMSSRPLQDMLLAEPELSRLGRIIRSH
ncbi:hypothetical protein RHMOL_Rhmol06G0261700 [Rhododendron molle]|uniref:Uncharacterized protein n=1 Tax=Rhododendron molle TaxID=49168 RepID=A0ACC0NIG1_RHOML|nr:hypothetical protein RHMOL_Rhmol06G0261700 [Rhododendron molle]